MISRRTTATIECPFCSMREDLGPCENIVKSMDRPPFIDLRTAESIARSRGWRYIALDAPHPERSPMMVDGFCCAECYGKLCEVIHDKMMPVMPEEGAKR